MPFSSFLLENSFQIFHPGGLSQLKRHFFAKFLSPCSSLIPPLTLSFGWLALATAERMMFALARMICPYSCYFEHMVDLGMPTNGRPLAADSHPWMSKNIVSPLSSTFPEHYAKYCMLQWNGSGRRRAVFTFMTARTHQDKESTAFIARNGKIYWYCKK